MKSKIKHFMAYMLCRVVESDKSNQQKPNVTTDSTQTNIDNFKEEPKKFDDKLEKQKDTLPSRDSTDYEVNSSKVITKNGEEKITSSKQENDEKFNQSSSTIETSGYEYSEEEIDIYSVKELNPPKNGDVELTESSYNDGWIT